MEFTWEGFGDDDDERVPDISADGMTFRASNLVKMGLHILGEEFMAEHVKEVFFHRENLGDDGRFQIIVFTITCQHIDAADTGVMSAIQKVAAGMFRSAKMTVTYDEGALRIGKLGMPGNIEVLFATELKPDSEAIVAEFMAEVEATLGPSTSEPGQPPDPDDPMSRWL